MNISQPVALYFGEQLTSAPAGVPAITEMTASVWYGDNAMDIEMQRIRCGVIVDIIACLSPSDFLAVINILIVGGSSLWESR